MKFSEKTMQNLSKYSDKQLKAFGTFFIIVGILLIPIIIGVIFIIIGVSYFKIIKQRQQERIAEVFKQPNKDTNYNLFDNIYNNAVLKYEYEENICVEKNISLAGKESQFIIFKQEPENEFDNRAIAIYLEDNKIGYVYKGKIQDMINDWIQRNEPILAYINKVSEKVTYKVAFYKPFNLLESKSYSLTKTSKKIDEDTKRIDNIELMSENDIIQVDFDENTYIVYDENYNELGELPQSAQSFIGDDEVAGFISEISENENGTLKVKVELFKTIKTF